MTGDIAIAGRNGQFEVRYDLPERVLPAEVLAAPALTEEEAVRGCSAGRPGPTVSDRANYLADYYRGQDRPGPRRSGGAGGGRRAGAGQRRGVAAPGVPAP